MSNKTPDTTTPLNPDVAQQPNYAKRLIAGAALAAIAIGGVVYKEYSDHASSHESHGRSDKNTSPSATEKSPTPMPESFNKLFENTSPAALKIFEKLPGFGKQVTEQERAMMHAATVKVVVSDKNQHGNTYMEQCTGLKVSVGGQTYVATARHCFDESLDIYKEYPSLYTDIDPNTAPDLHQTKTITSALSERVGIWTVGADGQEDISQTAPVSNVSVRYYPDIALLKVNETSPSSAVFDKLPAVSYDAGLSNEAVPGSETSVFGMPIAADGTVIESRGIYLGRVNNPSDPAQKLDLIGINPKSPAEDACSYGASGSVAMIAGGVMTGPLAPRNNITNAVGTNEADDPVRDMGLRKDMAAQLNLNLDGFSTICGYSVVTPAIVHGLAQANEQ